MKRFFYCLGLATMVMSQQASALAALQESNTVASAQLITDFAVVKTGGENDVSILAYLLKAPEDKEHGPTPLAISTNETLTFSVGGSSVVCLQDKDCRLPFVKDGFYQVEVKRFNGEVFKSQVTLPEDISILSPAENSFFRKSEDIHFSWTPSHAPTRGVTFSVFLAGLNCDTEGFTNWDTDFTAVVPANYVAACPGPVKARFTAFYLNTAAVPGAAGGVLKGYSLANVHLTYLGEDLATQSVLPGEQPLSRAELQQILRQVENSPKAGQTLLRH